MNQHSPKSDTKEHIRLPVMKNGRRWLLLPLGIVILLSGIAIGAGGGFFFHKKMIVSAFQHPEQIPENITGQMKKKLNLSAEQTEQVKAILTKRMRIVREIREEIRPRIEEQIDLTKEEVAGVLDESQAKQWREEFVRFLRILPPPLSAHREKAQTP